MDQPAIAVWPASLIGQFNSTTFRLLDAFNVDRRGTLLFGIGTEALPLWGQEDGRNNLHGLPCRSIGPKAQAGQMSI
jgi:hypothetical protein